MSPFHRRHDEITDRQIADFQRRYTDLERLKKRSRDTIKEDALSRMFTDRIVRGDKISYDSHLQGMLTDTEHARLETDPGFTKAWRMFVDRRWIKRQILRAVLMIAGILLVCGMLIGGYYILPWFSSNPTP